MRRGIPPTRRCRRGAGGNGRATAWHGPPDGHCNRRDACRQCDRLWSDGSGEELGGPGMRSGGRRIPRRSRSWIGEAPSEPLDDRDSQTPRPSGGSKDVPVTAEVDPDREAHNRWASPSARAPRPLRSGWREAVGRRPRDGARSGADRCRFRIGPASRRESSTISTRTSSYKSSAI